MSKERHPAELLFTESHPLTAALNMTFLPESKDILRVELDAPSSFTDPKGDRIHTGFNTLLLDTVLGSCAIGHLEKLQPIATIKLSCNHLRHIGLDEPLACIATWTGEQNEVSYVTGEIINRESGEQISHAIGTFMIGTASRPLTEKQGGN